MDDDVPLYAGLGGGGAAGLGGFGSLSQPAGNAGLAGGNLWQSQCGAGNGIAGMFPNFGVNTPQTRVPHAGTGQFSFPPDRGIPLPLLMEDHFERKEKKRDACVCIPSYPTPEKMSVEAWTRTFVMTCERLNMDESLALDVFFLKVRLPGWIAEQLAKDRKDEKSADMDEWLVRLEQSFQAQRSSRMLNVTSRKQGDAELAEHFVNEIVRLAKEADILIDDEDLAQKIEANIHPKWKPAYTFSNPNARTSRDVITGLTKVMSPDFEPIRKLLQQKESTAAADEAPDVLAHAFAAVEEDEDASGS